MLRHLPSHQRPRERLLEVGEEALSLTELLAILLGTGTQGKSVLQLSNELLETFGSLQALLEASIEELKTIKGIGQAKAIQLKAAFAVARRYTSMNQEASRRSLYSSNEAYILLKDKLEHLQQEALFVVLRDVRGHVISVNQVALGTLSEVLVHPREVFYPAVRHKAHSVIIAHNHPSGDPTPSLADLEMTRQLMHSGQIMGIPIDDHLIIGKNSFVSLKDSPYAHRGAYGLFESHR
ncbi:MAG: DNA repair protein RadC [Simkania sp.]|nr:DNA repair protein RadC [Simkania sp.]